MTRTLRTALVLSVAAHVALLLWRLQSEPPVEGDLLSLNVRLSVEAGESAAPQSPPTTDEATETPAAEAVAEGVPDEAPPEAPETLIAEETTPPAVVEEATVQAEAPPSTETPPEPMEPPEEPAPESIETVAEAVDGPPTEAAPERPIQAVTPLQTITPRPAPAEAATAEPEEPAERPARPQVAFTDRQQRMLDRKVEIWGATFHRMDPTEPTVTWKHRGQSYTATFEQVLAADDRSIDELLIQISTEADGETLSTELRMKKLAFSNFAQFIDEWDPRVSMHDDEIGGRFHSNTEVHLAFDSRAAPVFHGKVTTSSRGINTDNARGGAKRADMFLGGLETGVRQIHLPRELTPFPGDVDADQVHYFEEDTRLAFYPDGTFGRQALESPEPEALHTIGDRSAYLVAGPKVALHVRGIVNGAVLVYSPGNIVVEDDIVYANDPALDPESDDYLGLVADRFVKIAGRETTGVGDLTIHASIYAKRRFSVGRFGSNDDGALVIYGSLTAGSISATEPRYRTKIDFDPRLERTRAPSFPMTDRYEVASWDGVWDVL